MWCGRVVLNWFLVLSCGSLPLRLFYFSLFVGVLNGANGTILLCDRGSILYLQINLDLCIVYTIYNILPFFLVGVMCCLKRYTGELSVGKCVRLAGNKLAGGTVACA